MASGDAVEQIKNRLSIIDVISPYVELHKAGKSFKGKSPFTNEKTPSFHVSPERGMYYCFSSSQGGDMFTFIEKMEGVDFKGALKILAEKAGVELVPEDPKKRTERETLHAIAEEACKYFERELTQNDEAEAYLKDRAVKADTIKKWRIGYVPGPPQNGWRHTRTHLKGHGFSDEMIEKAGLIKSAGPGKEPYDVFRDRVMFPIMDSSGRTVAFSGRILTKDSDAPKYVNSPEGPLFNKSEILFGYDKAKEGIRKYDFSLIVEGQFDVVMSHQAGYNNAVAVSGTALTQHHVALLQRLSNRIVLALDSDRAGISAVKRAADIMLARGIDLKVAALPEGADPADLIKEGTGGFKKAIGGATHVIEFLLAVIRKEAKDDRSFKLRVRDEVLPYLLKIDSHIDREHFVGVVAEALGTKTDAVSLEVARLAEKEKHRDEREVPEKPKENVQTDVPTVSRLQNLETFFATVPTLLEDTERVVVESQYKRITGESLQDLQARAPAEVTSRLVFELENSFGELTTTMKREELTEKLSQFHELYLKQKIRQVRTRLVSAEERGDEAEAAECLNTLSELQKSLSLATYTPDIFSEDITH